MNTASILQDKGDEVHTIAPSAQLLEAARTLDDKRIGALVVVDERRRVRGVLSERDLTRKVAREGAAALDAAVSDAMTREMITASPSDRIDALMERMTDRRVRHLPVIDEGCLVGIVSIGDVVKWKIQAAETEARAMRDYITAG